MEQSPIIVEMRVSVAVQSKITPCSTQLTNFKKYLDSQEVDNHYSVHRCRHVGFVQT